jgi:hypothetical protein
MKGRSKNHTGKLRYLGNNSLAVLLLFAFSFASYWRCSSGVARLISIVKVPSVGAGRLAGDAGIG